MWVPPGDIQPQTKSDLLRLLLLYRFGGYGTFNQKNIILGPFIAHSRLEPTTYCPFAVVS